MNEKTVDFYFTYLSPYAFMANTRINEMLVPLGVTLRYKPIGHKSSSDGPKFNPVRYEYIVEEDVPRYAEEYGLAFIPRPPLTESHTASRGFLYAEEQYVGEEYNDLVFRARWSDGKDISRTDVLADIAERTGLDRHAFLAAIQNPFYTDKLSEIEQQAAEAGVFGAPLFVYEGKRFWGNDRVDWLVRELTKEAA